MKLKKLVSIIMVGWFLIGATVIVGLTSCNNQPEDHPWPPSTQTKDSIVLKVPVVSDDADVVAYGDNIIYIHAYRDSLANRLNRWIKDHPHRVITTAIYDPERGAHPTAEGYFFIHYPDTAFTMFHFQ